MEAEQIKGQSVNKNHQKSLLKNHDAWNEHRSISTIRKSFHEARLKSQHWQFLYNQVSLVVTFDGAWTLGEIGLVVL